MANQLINIRIPKELYNEIEQFTKIEGYTNIQEFTRQSIREKVEKLRTKQVIFELTKLKGSQKGKKKLATKEELEKLAKKFYS
ncbi:MAG: ribbon-helix-helix domain-containing protein [Candidatus Woesearchaeota archaeon]